MKWKSGKLEQNVNCGNLFGVIATLFSVFLLFFFTGKWKFQLRINSRRRSSANENCRIWITNGISLLFYLAHHFRCFFSFFFLVFTLVFSYSFLSILLPLPESEKVLPRYEKCTIFFVTFDSVVTTPFLRRFILRKIPFNAGAHKPLIRKVKAFVADFVICSDSIRSRQRLKHFRYFYLLTSSSSASTLNIFSCLTKKQSFSVVLIKFWARKTNEKFQQLLNQNRSEF